MIKNILNGFFAIMRPFFFYGGIFTASMLGAFAAADARPDYAAESPAHQAGAASLTSVASDGDMILLGWGIGSCGDDEWNYGYGCMHIDAMPADDPRLNMINTFEVIDQS